VRSESGLEVANFQHGSFTNYSSLSLGYRSEEAKDRATRGLNDEPTVWDMANRRAELSPEDNSSFPEVTLTDIEDVGRLVAAACELSVGSWEEDMGFVGEMIRLDEVVGLVKEELGLDVKLTTVRTAELEERTNAIERIGVNGGQIWENMVSQMKMLLVGDRMGTLRWSRLRTDCTRMSNLRLCVNISSR